MSMIIWTINKNVAVDTTKSLVTNQTHAMPFTNCWKFEMKLNVYMRVYIQTNDSASSNMHTAQCAQWTNDQTKKKSLYTHSIGMKKCSSQITPWWHSGLIKMFLVRCWCLCVHIYSFSVSISSCHDRCATNACYIYSLDLSNYRSKLKYLLWPMSSHLFVLHIWCFYQTNRKWQTERKKYRSMIKKYYIDRLSYRRL